MEKFEGIVKLTNDYMFDSQIGWKWTTMHIYKFVDDEDKVYVWKTSSYLGIDHEEENGEIWWEKATLGSTIRIKGSIKCENEYRGEHQTVLNRVKVLEIIDRALTKEEKDEIKAKEQMESLNEGDFIYEMPYRQYKTHYSDCETLANSYNNENCTIGVIIREGRLKNSGVRFHTFDTYRFICKTPDGKELIQCRYAVSEKNARKRVEKDFPQYNWVFDQIVYRR